MAKSKTLTPQEIYRQRRQREESERTAYLPPGLINHGNTCFMNSVLQGLIATRLLSDLVHFNPIPPEIQMAASTPIVSRRSPQLTNGHNLAGAYEQPWVNSMPIGDMFLTVMYKAWDSQAARKRDILSPKPVLSALGQKYDQYLDFAQQDAHEFLRILLDAMRMEEQDIIKKRQPPPPPNHHKKRRRTTITPGNLNDPPTDPSSQNNGDAPPESDLPLLSFADMIFGGQLTSILVCQKCKHVSQTYEEFNDISLSIKAEDYFPNNRKRDRFKKIVGRLTQFPGSSASQSNHPHKAHAKHLPITTAHAVEMLRSSSVPPSPRTERDGMQLQAELLIVEPRRRSLDVPVGGAESGPDSPEIPSQAPAALPAEVPDQHGLEAQQEKTSDSREDDGTLDSDNSHVIVNITGPEDKHVEFVEPKSSRREKHESASAAPATEKDKDKEKNQKDDIGWAKIGRRISLTVGLGRPKDKDKKERDRKSRSMDRSSLGVPDSIKEDGVPDMAMQKSLSASASIASTPSIVGDSASSVKSRVSSDSAAMLSRTVASEFASSSTNGVASSSSSTKQPKPLPPRPTLSSTSVPTISRSSSPQPSSSQQQLLSAALPAAGPSTSIFPNVQRSKSPKPPKPNAAETEYLRKILADISSSPASNNPFAIFKPPMLHSHTSHHSTHAGLAGAGGAGLSTGGTGFEKDKEKSTTWLGIGMRNFSGIEECLRMFTAVEVLDGENMVGCRRCWKIQNGVLHTSKGKDSDHEEEEDEDEQGERVSPLPPPPLHTVDGGPAVNGVAQPEEFPQKGRLALKILAPTTATHIPTSLSTPTVSFYSHANTSDTRSVSSLPTEATSTSETSLLEDADEDSPLSLSVISESSARTRNSGPNDTHPGPGGMPIPMISTTAPPDTPKDSSMSFKSHSSSVAAENRGTQDRDLPSTAPPAVLNARPHLAQALNGYDSSPGSKDSLVIPQIRKPKLQKRRISYSDTTTDDNDSSGDESDTSVGTSMSADSVVSRPNGMVTNQKPPVQAAAAAATASSSKQQEQPPAAAPTPQKKPSKPKPVIMRPAYKRYLIATPPPVLVVHLKRFQQTSKTPLMSFSHGFKKLDDYVSFPEYLDLMPFLAPRKEDYGLGKKGKDKERKHKAKDVRCMYRLYAVVVHIGNMLGGHYIAYTALPADSPVPPPPPTAANGAPEGTSAATPATNSADNAGGDKEASKTPMPEPAHHHPNPAERQWAYISDTVVRLTTLEEVLHAKAYICMYERC
ncbi:hypothetical protein BDZ97DRAFT_1792545 [Flammula alnicola]|nr:hypothetical protein BDZ97DRAFT_1792545 [Flammula alnicola]